ncbi:MAG: phosphoenolpyruvate--protein phosphotransferase [Thermaerobacter sp.]|nr:phosphoenolpyruvate--protein phosphotransferase [Thermaerobacter sp.]
MLLKGLGISAGQANGPGRRFVPRNQRREQAPADLNMTPAELITQVRQELEDLKRQATSDIIRDVLAAQLLMVDDPDLWDRIEELLRAGHSLKTSIEQAVASVASTLENLGDRYFAARADDVRDIGLRLVAHLSAPQTQERWTIREPSILVAESLFPSDTATLDLAQIRGFVLGQGSVTSHVAILARSLQIPAVVVGDAIASITEGEPLFIDGTDGLVSTGSPLPGAASSPGIPAQPPRWPVIANRVTTRDGQPVLIMANVGSVAEARIAVQNGADGIGLLRTEFLFDGSHPPSLTDHRQMLGDIAEILGPDRELIVRLADIGGDKPLPYLAQKDEANPFLGVRAIRLLKEYPHLYDDQLRAAIEVGQHARLKVMIPMVASRNDWTVSRALVAAIADELALARVPLGMMVEVPAAALDADYFAETADFFSIGTNDLIQYLYAADRTASELAEYNSSLEPAAAAAIRMTIEAAHAHQIPVAMCGEMAGDPQALPLLLGLGLREFSMNPASIPQFKAMIQDLDARQCRAALG